MNQSQLQRAQRINNILNSLKKLDYLTQRQLQVMHNLKGDRNAHRVITSMSQYLDCFRNGLEMVYYLNKKGREFIGSEKIRKKIPNVDHYLLRNQYYIKAGQPSAWKNEIKIKLGETSIICDALYYHNKIPVFVEVDCQQPMSKNKQKIDKYRRFMESGQAFSLVFVTQLEGRRVKLTELLDGIPGAVLTAEEIN